MLLPYMIPKLWLFQRLLADRNFSMRSQRSVLLFSLDFVGHQGINKTLKHLKHFSRYFFFPALPAKLRHFQAMDSVTLWIALSPQQFDDLLSGQEVQPDEFSQRFGLRTSPAAAIERAHYFMEWTPSGPRQQHCPEHFRALEVHISALGDLDER